MADRKATNKYYPPDWDPSKGSVNKLHGQHPLRERARKLSEGILIIRFELPFNIWCGGCERHLARGVRFNAEKKQVGNYLSTPIWSFRMKCPSCSGWIEIRTDPEHSEYLVTEGGRRKQEGAMNFEEEKKKKEEEAKLIYNPFSRIEHDWKDGKSAEAARPRLQQLIALNGDIWRGDFDASLAARRELRKEKEVLKEEAKKQADIQKRLGAADLPLLPEDDRDTVLAASVTFRKTGKEEDRMAQIQASTIMTRRSSKRTTTQSKADRLLNKLKSKKSLSILDQLQL